MKALSYLPVFTVISALSFASCSKSSTPTSSAGPLFTVADFEPVAGKVDKREKTDMATLLDKGEDDDLYANTAEKDTTDPDQPAAYTSCIDSKMNSIKATGTNGKITFGGTIDLGDCYKLLANEKSTLKSVSITFGVYVEAECASEDLTKYNGKTIKELSVLTDQVCSNKSGKRTLLGNIKSVFALNAVNKEDNKETDYEMHSYTARFTSAAKPCEGTVADGKITWTDGCLDVSRFYFKKYRVDGKAQETLEGKEDIEKYESVSLVEADDETSAFYESGKRKATINNWTGTITYNGVATPASYSMTDGTDTITGTIPVTPATSFAAKAKFSAKVFNQKLDEKILVLLR